MDATAHAQYLSKGTGHSAKPKVELPPELQPQKIMEIRAKKDAPENLEGLPLLRPLVALISSFIISF